MKQSNGMFAARMWGFQFAALCMVLSACQSTPETMLGEPTLGTTAPGLVGQQSQRYQRLHALDGKNLSISLYEKKKGTTTKALIAREGVTLHHDALNNTLRAEKTENTQKCTKVSAGTGVNLLKHCFGNVEVDPNADTTFINSIATVYAATASTPTPSTAFTTAVSTTQVGVFVMDASTDAANSDLPSGSFAASAVNHDGYPVQAASIIGGSSGTVIPSYVNGVFQYYTAYVTDDEGNEWDVTATEVTQVSTGGGGGGGDNVQADPCASKKVDAVLGIAAAAGVVLGGAVAVAAAVTVVPEVAGVSAAGSVMFTGGQVWGMTRLAWGALGAAALGAGIVFRGAYNNVKAAYGCSHPGHTAP